MGTNALRAARVAAGMSQQQLAIAAGIRRESISHYESGLHEPGVWRAIRMAAVLGVPVEELFPVDTQAPLR